MRRAAGHGRRSRHPGSAPPSRLKRTAHPRSRPRFPASTTATRRADQSLRPMRLPATNAGPDPCAPPGGGAARRARPASRTPSQTRSTPRSGQQKGHSRKRLAGRAACARACGPAAALTPGRASVRRGKPGRATSGGAAGGASVRTADPRVPLHHQRFPDVACEIANPGALDDARSDLRTRGTQAC